MSARARAQIDVATSAHQAQLLAQKTQNESLHLQVKTQSEIALAKADLDANSRCSMRI
ncbi:MAG TPA: hypothetical protein VFW23_04765 [Tepidisphaeraceae bacterium]|nr:hypothetical protein [Tepidisphaeraceae bacterium]